MDMRKQGGEGQGTARSASKSAGRKQPGEQASTTGAQGTTATQGMPGGSGDTGTAGATGTQGKTATQGTPGQQGGAQDLLQHAKHAGGEIVNQVQERAGSQINRGKETAATQLSQVANAVRRLGENLGGEDVGPIGRYATDYGEKAAENIERLSNYIREQDPKQLLNDVQNFGRRRPVVLLGGAFLLGFAGARLIKSAMETASQQQSLHTNVPASNYTGTNVSTPRPSPAPNAR
jgi:hypothetical protein